MRIRRGELTDLYVEGGRGVTMIDESVLVLSEIATAIVEAVPEGEALSIEEVVTSLLAIFGEPEPPASARHLTLQQVHDLASHGVLTLEEDSGDAEASPNSPLSKASTGDRAAAVDALRQALRQLRSSTPTTWSLPSGVPPGEFMAAARRHYVIPYLAANLARLELPPRIGTDLTVSAGRHSAGAALLKIDLIRALEALEMSGIRALAFKGLALATQAYGDFRLRGAGDIDLLVPASQLDAAHGTLSRAGWLPASGHPAPGSTWAWRHFVRTGNELALTRETSAIDLHWHLAPTRGTFPEFEALWRRRSIVTVGDHEVPSLGAFDALAHSAGHAAKDRWRWLRSLLDVHMLAAQPDAWLGADRPLRGDQLTSVGLAARAFGIPPGAPSVVEEAHTRTASLWAQVQRLQAQTAPTHRSQAVPGVNFLLTLQGLARTDGSPREAVRLLSRSAMPPWLTAEEASSHALTAAPRVLARRASAAVRRLAAP